MQGNDRAMTQPKFIEQVEPDPSLLEEQYAAAPGHLVRRAYQLWREIVADEISQFGLDPTEYAILSQIGRTPGINRERLLRRQVFDPQQGAQIIRQLERRGLLYHRRAHWRKPGRVLTLTQRGESIVAKAAPYDDYAHGRCLAPLTKDEQAEFLRLITKLVETPHRSRVFRHLHKVD